MLGNAAGTPPPSDLNVVLTAGLEHSCPWIRIICALERKLVTPFRRRPPKANHLKAAIDLVETFISDVDIATMAVYFTRPRCPIAPRLAFTMSDKPTVRVQYRPPQTYSV
jgi:hypothetical protein